MKIVDGSVRLSASDVANFLACRHLTRLDLLHARGLLGPPYQFDAGFEALVERGDAHERAVLDRFRGQGFHVTEIPRSAEAVGAAATAEAMDNQAEVIYQAVARPATNDGGPALLGRPDFLIRADLIPAPDGEPRGSDRAGYEVVDAKLARTAKARAVAQTAFYSSLLGTDPRWMHLALGTGGGELTSLRVADYAAYERQTRRLLAEFIENDAATAPPSDTYPEPVEHCAICRWRPACASRRRSDDDLSLIAGMTAIQRKALREAGVATRREFAGLAGLPVLSRVSEKTLERSRSQARLQVMSEDAERIEYSLLEPERDTEGALVANRGLLALPEPAEGDLFFDIEGSRYYSEDGQEYGLQYLFGIVDTAEKDENGTPRYRQFWAFDREGEKQAFEDLIDFITARRAERPGLHVYHYNHYEPTAVDHLSELHETRQEAVGRLMGRFATREDQVDDLFRLGVFVDLYRVVRQALQAGVESYSIKRLEPLCGYTRKVGLHDATVGLIALESALDDGSAERDRPRQAVIAGYNEDDCRATLALRDWLEERRPELAADIGGDVPRPQVAEPVRSPEDPAIIRIKSALLSGVPARPADRTEEQQASALLADLLDWHRRENKPAWWRYFYVRTLSSQELIDEPDALGGLTGGTEIGRVKRSVVRRFCYPPQEHHFSEGQGAFDSLTNRGWQVYSVDDASGVIDLKVSADYDGPLPAGLVEGGPPDTRTLAARLRDLGERVMHDGLGGHDDATALLLRRHPADAAGSDLSLRAGNEQPADAAIRLAAELGDSFLPIQGPPGTGKTYAGADQALHLLALGRKVGITGPSHAVIQHFIDEILKHAPQQGLCPRIGQRAESDNPFLHPGATSLTYDKLAAGLADGDLDVIAGTAWLWARPDFRGSVDTLFIDEAGQMSLANVLAMAGAARNLVLLGDPQQLAQPSQAAHPPGAGVSALEHILAGRATMPADAGLLIDRTWRMHPKLCRFTSDLFYDGRLGWEDGLERQSVLGDGALQGAGLHIVPVTHDGNTNSSPEEAVVVADLVQGVIGHTWRDRHDTERPITVDDIMVVTPFNAQIRAIQQAASVLGLTGLRVGTVDKFQGRDAPIVIYSMASSSAEDAPRGMEFLYDLHRLNVATSRARALAVIVASPDLIRVACSTPRQMFLANALCQAWETGAPPEG